MISYKEVPFYTSLFIIILIILLLIPVMGVDFKLLYPAGRAALSLKNPYIEVKGFFNPPWMLLFIVPISLFPIQLARWIWFCIGVIVYFIAFKRLKFDNATILILFCSPFIYYDLGIGNYEWLILLGASLQPEIGSWITALKPQASLVLFSVWLKQRQWKVLIPVAIIFVLIYLGIYSLPATKNMPWSADIFPWGIPVGLVISYFAIKKENKLLALAAAPFLAPYIAVQSWIFTLLPLTVNKKVLILAVLASWVLVYLFMLVA